MIDKCKVRYGRRTHKPFKTGIEGAECVLSSHHDGKHRARIATADFDGTELFEFEEGQEEYGYDVARDMNRDEIRVGDRVFVDRDRESFLVIKLRPFVSKPNAYWVVVDDPINGVRSCFDIAVRLDKR